MSNMDHTMKYNAKSDEVGVSAKEILVAVYEALEEKGYDPINQIVGYLLSGDPAFIPRHQNARTLIGKLERDEILDELVRNYLQQHRSALLREKA